MRSDISFLLTFYCAQVRTFRATFSPISEDLRFNRAFTLRFVYIQSKFTPNSWNIDRKEKFKICIVSILPSASLICRRLAIAVLSAQVWKLYGYHNNWISKYAPRNNHSINNFTFFNSYYQRNIFDNRIFLNSKTN